MTIKKSSTVQRRLCESGLHGQMYAKKPLLKATKNKKRLAWAKKHGQWTFDRWKSVLIFGSNRLVFVRHRVGERMISACVFPTVKHEGGGVMVWGCFAGDTICDLLTSMATTAFCCDTPSHLLWA